MITIILIILVSDSKRFSEKVKDDFLEDDRSFPIRSSQKEPVDTTKVASSICFERYNKNKICHQSPRLCHQNACFLVDESTLIHKKDIFCDLHGL